MGSRQLARHIPAHVRRCQREVTPQPVYTLPMPDIQALFADYASYHRTKGNKALHRLGIPLIMLTLIGMLVRVHVAGRVDAAMILIALSEIYYLLAEWRLPTPLLPPGIPLFFPPRG